MKNFRLVPLPLAIAGATAFLLIDDSAFAVSLRAAIGIVHRQSSETAPIAADAGFPYAALVVMSAPVVILAAVVAGMITAQKR